MVSEAKHPARHSARFLAALGMTVFNLARFELRMPSFQVPTLSVCPQTVGQPVSRIGIRTECNVFNCKCLRQFCALRVVVILRVARKVPYSQVDQGLFACTGAPQTIRSPTPVGRQVEA